MKQFFQPWKLVIVLMFLMIFSSLFSFIYTEQVKLPSENWSNQLEIDTYNPKMDFKSLSSNNTTAIAIDDTQFVNVVALDDTLRFKMFNINGVELYGGEAKFDHNITEVSGTLVNDKIELITLSESNDKVSFITILPKDFTEINRKEVALEGMTFKLSNNHVTAYDRTRVAIIKEGQTTIFEPDFDGRIELAEVDTINGETLVCAITMKGSTYKLSVMTDDGSSVVSKNLHILPSLSAINPVNVTMAIDEGQVIVISTMKHMRFGNNYVDFFNFNINDITSYEHSGYEVDTFEAIPYLIKEENGQVSYLINFWASNLGRTEIAKGVQAYPNLYKTTHGTDEFKQLTKSERSSVKPSYLKMGHYEYLVHNEQNDLDNKVYLSSNNPEMIASSRDYSQSTLMDIFLRTITTYPALILAGIPPMMTVILPLLVITAPILMFKLNWAEQNKQKMTLILLGVFLASKTYTFGFDIFKFFEAEGLWPPFLEAPSAHWLTYVLFSALTLFVYSNRMKTREGKNDHFLKSISFYVILDLVIMITFFMPYSII